MVFLSFALIILHFVEDAYGLFRNSTANHGNICPRAPDVLFDTRGLHLNTTDSDSHRPLSARSTSSTLTRQLSNLTLTSVSYN